MYSNKPLCLLQILFKTYRFYYSVWESMRLVTLEISSCSSLHLQQSKGAVFKYRLPSGSSMSLPDLSCYTVVHGILMSNEIMTSQSSPLKDDVKWANPKNLYNCSKRTGSQLSLPYYLQLSLLYNIMWRWSQKRSTKNMFIPLFKNLFQKLHQCTQLMDVF